MLKNYNLSIISNANLNIIDSLDVTIHYDTFNIFYLDYLYIELI